MYNLSIVLNTLVQKNGPTLSLDKTLFFINIITCKQITNFYCYSSHNWYYSYYDSVLKIVPSKVFFYLLKVKVA